MFHPEHCWSQQYMPVLAENQDFSMIVFGFWIDEPMGSLLCPRPA
ncbi:hypothetical protein [Acaryochloris marina]|nr:hypothetical protein [Acaryochloris marina]